MKILTQFHSLTLLYSCDDENIYYDLNAIIISTSVIIIILFLIKTQNLQK